jgi:Tol biopolymer transport system component
VALTDWSPDGKYILLHLIEARSKTGLDAVAYSIPERKIFPIMQTAAFDCCSRLSPDGRWVSYTSAVSGRNETYVQPFPVATGRFQISTTGGTQARWSGDGKELYYIGADNKIMAVDVRSGETFEAGIPKPLFSVRTKPGGWPYDASRDGRFLINETVHAEGVTPITVVFNWNANPRP